MILEIILGTSIFGIGHAFYRKYSAKYRVLSAELLEDYEALSIGEDFKVYDNSFADDELIRSITEAFSSVTKRTYVCSRCGEEGHNVRTCNTRLQEGEEE